MKPSLDGLAAALGVIGVAVGLAALCAWRPQIAVVLAAVLLVVFPASWAALRLTVLK